MQLTFFSSRIEEEKRRDFLLGSRRFKLGEAEFYYSYSPELCRLKERVLRAVNDVAAARRRFDPLTQVLDERWRLLREADASASIDHYGKLPLLRTVYRNGGPILKFPLRQKPWKNLSTEAGFSIASRFNEIDAAQKAIDEAKIIALAISEEDSLLGPLLFHFLEEYIHPYSRGNGLIGRLGLSRWLSDSLWSPIAISIAWCFSRDTTQYFLAFKRSESAAAHGNLNPYFEGVLSLIADGIEAELYEIKERETWISNRVLELESNALTAKEKRIGEAVIKMRAYRPSKLSFRSLAAIMNVSERTLYRCLSSLKTKGIVTKNALSD